jgi:TRAP-type uncharacterized transport system substrate-binding protein
MKMLAEEKIDISPSVFILNFLMARSVGPYASLGKKKGAELASNIRILYAYHIAPMFPVISFTTKGIDSWDKLKGKKILNGPPRGGALTTARGIIRLVAGVSEGKGYIGKQVGWSSFDSTFLDGGVDATVRPATNPPGFMPLYTAAGKVTVVSIPKDKFYSPAFQKLVTAPGNVPNITPIKDMNWGKGVNIISEDGMHRSLAQVAGDAVHKNMSKSLAKKITAAFISTQDSLNRKTPWAKSSKYTNMDDKQMGFCKAGVKFHPGAIEAYKEAGISVPACAIP